MTSIPDSYEQSRARFRTRLDALISRWPQAYLTVLPLASDTTLTIDFLTATALTVKERLIVITSGEHGIEGYLGSALMELFFEEYLSNLDPRTNGLLLVHAINPWGMRYRERENPVNVDLNRNFIDDDIDTLKTTNPDYPALAGYFAPQKPINNLASVKWSFVYATIKYYLAFGSKRIREAALMGQYHSPGGIYYGGSERQPETATLMDVYRRAFAGYQEIIHLDMHTGYGPRDRMTMVTSPYEVMTGEEIVRRFNAPRVAAANPDEFYTIQGDMIDWEYRLVKREFPQTKFFAATCEFGTYGNSILQAARSLYITILKNQLNQCGASPQAAEWINREYLELYLPSEPAWLEKALADTRQVFTAVVG